MLAEIKFLLQFYISYLCVLLDMKFKTPSNLLSLFKLKYKM